MTDLNEEQFGGHSGSGIDIGADSLSKYGIHPVSVEDEVHYRKYHPSEWVGKHRDVPMSSIRGGQNYVDRNRVTDIARHGLNNPREAESAETVGTELPSGHVMLNDGHHRVAAAALNGEQFTRVFVGTRYLPPRTNRYDPQGLHDVCE